MRSVSLGHPSRRYLCIHHAFCLPHSLQVSDFCTSICPHIVLVMSVLISSYLLSVVEGFVSATRLLR